MEMDQATDRAPENRDPHNNNAFVKVSYSDVICERAAVQIPQGPHQFTKIIFDKTLLGTYWFFTILLGAFLSFALVWLMEC
ncbi:hypothetical protein OS493_008264 [Desmophyllum pertusum]|uniref:Caveolin n=1 Tax=Desmophyllum pertusum TaxID=174260 RepID=A0A9X0A414_9CNID|nr:hypothetical protein OS493_008264 [Desmophyllum pertusum]